MVILAIAVSGVAAGCGGAARVAPTRVAGAASRVAPAVAPVPTTLGLPEPVPVPADPYAPEPVVMIGTIQIPRIGLTHGLYEGITLNNIDKGPSHWPGSAMPGQPGNAVIAGHRSTHGQPFRRIAELVPGDTVLFTVGAVQTTYRVTGNLVVDPTDTWIADPTPAPTATLFACHPPGSAAQRYVVRLELAAR